MFWSTDCSLQDTLLHQLRQGVSSHDNRESPEIQDAGDGHQDVRTETNRLNLLIFHTWPAKSEIQLRHLWTVNQTNERKCIYTTVYRIYAT